MKKIVTIGGGTGSYTILSAIKDIPEVEVCAIVAMTDDGGSTGRLRDELGVLPAGDVRQCLVALSSEDYTMRQLMSYRFEDGGLRGHSFGNLLLAGLEKITGSFASAVEEASKILNIKGEVLPIVNSNVKLSAMLNDGSILNSENEINHAEFEKVGIKSLHLSDNKIYYKSAKKLLEADYIFIGPGNHYCSILPALAVEGLKDIFKNTKAKIVYISNLTNKKGHNSFFKVTDYLRDIEKCIDRKVDIVLVNDENPTREQVEFYELQEGDGVMVVDDMQEDKRLLRKNLLSSNINLQDSRDDVASTRSFIRHDKDKLKNAIEELVNL